MHEISKSIATVIVRNGIKPESQYDRCLYGLELLLPSAVTTAVILIMGFITGTLLQTLTYIAVYWGVHSAARSYHCSKFSRCLLLSTGLAFGMMIMCRVVETQCQIVLSWMFWLATFALLATQVLDESKSAHFTKKRYIVCGTSVLISLVLLFSQIALIAFPFTYGMFVISILQAKARRRA